MTECHYHPVPVKHTNMRLAAIAPHYILIPILMPRFQGWLMSDTADTTPTSTTRTVDWSTPKQLGAPTEG